MFVYTSLLSIMYFVIFVSVIAWEKRNKNSVHSSFQTLHHFHLKCRGDVSMQKRDFHDTDRPPLKSPWSWSSNRQTPVKSVGGVSHVGPGCFIAGWGQAGQMLRSLTNSLQALGSAQGGQQRAEGLQEEEIRVFSDCQLIPQFYFSGILLSCPQRSTCLHRVPCSYRLNRISSFTGQNYS